jgi:hypothetical protein
MMVMVMRRVEPIMEVHCMRIVLIWGCLGSMDVEASEPFGKQALTDFLARLT